MSLFWHPNVTYSFNFINFLFENIIYSWNYCVQQGDDYYMGPTCELIEQFYLQAYAGLIEQMIYK